MSLFDCLQDERGVATPPTLHLACRYLPRTSEANLRTVALQMHAGPSGVGEGLLVVVSAPADGRPRFGLVLDGVAKTPARQA